MAITFKSPGVIITYKDYKEADRLYTIYTLNYGKLHLRAVGVKKIKSKLSGHLEPLCESDLFMAKSKTISIIGGARIINSHKKIKLDIDKIRIINYCLAIFNDLVLEEQADEELYCLLTGLLDFANSYSINELIEISFVLKLLNNLGLQPNYSDYNNDLAKILSFLSRDDFASVSRLRLTQKQWVILNNTFINLIKINQNKEFTKLVK
ncbi:MAG: DNA repair protein RecO [Patescibacteria group bacterium]